MAQSGDNWIVATGQLWKLYVALAGFLGTLLCFTLAMFSLGSDHGRVVAYFVCGGFLGIATFIWLIAVLRCPHCFGKLVWTMVTSRPHSSWIIDLAALDICPVCTQPLTLTKKTK